MKKHVTSILIFIFCVGFLLFSYQKPTLFKVVEIKNSDLICIDFNINNKCDANEHVKLYGINIFPEKFGNQSKYLQERYSIDEKHSVVLGVLAKDFLKENLLNEFVEVEILDDKTNKFILAKIYSDKTDYAQTLLKKGWALATADEYKIYENMSAVKKNIKSSEKFNYQLRNNKNGKIHTLDCEYGRKVSDYEIGIFDDEKYFKDYSKDCHKEIQSKTTKIPSKNFDYISDDIKVYFLDFTHTLKPDSSCSSSACKILLQNINNSKESIDFAIYGLGNIPKIESALKKASERGVKVRFVTDEDSNHENIYERTSALKIILPDCKTDYINGESAKFNNYIMHNKFFIFDNKSVWLGSANISETDLSGFSANNVIFIKSSNLAEIYKSEFEKLYNGVFHTKKVSETAKDIVIGNTEIKVAFSPQSNAVTNYLIPLIDNAKTSIYMESFMITHKALAESLIKAKSRGIDIKIIVDATTASNSYSMIKTLRTNGIKVKVENYAGKMHMKTVMIDDDYFISGSMNLTKSGEKYNDENIIFIKNKDINQRGKGFFKYIWEQIPDKYLNKNPKAESKESIGSCYDGIDNDYDGKIDKNDDVCK